MLSYFLVSKVQTFKSLFKATNLSNVIFAQESGFPCICFEFSLVFIGFQVRPYLSTFSPPFTETNLAFKLYVKCYFSHKFGHKSSLQSLNFDSILFFMALPTF